MDTLCIVGSGGPVATPEAFGTSVVLRSGDEYLMFDCGPAATHKMVKMGLSPGQIDHLFSPTTTRTTTWTIPHSC